MHYSFIKQYNIQDDFPDDFEILNCFSNMKMSEQQLIIFIDYIKVHRKNYSKKLKNRLNDEYDKLLEDFERCENLINDTLKLYNEPMCQIRKNNVIDFIRKVKSKLEELKNRKLLWDFIFNYLNLSLCRCAI